MYIYENQNWPNFVYDIKIIAQILTSVRFQQGRLLGQMQTLGFDFLAEAHLRVMLQDVIKTSEIEGEILDPAQVRSSLAKRLGIKEDYLGKVDQHVDGIVAVLLDTCERCQDPLTQERLFGWHAALFPTSYSGTHKITVAAWRDEASGPMQVVSGPIGQETVHFQAPHWEQVPHEMQAFLVWFNSETTSDLLLKAAIAHFWFVTIHPFDDGNGRLGRAVADMLLARSEGSPQRFYSLSSQIRLERKAYYEALERCQKSTLDITSWLVFFLNCLQNAIHNADVVLQLVLAKTKFWQQHQHQDFNNRQRLMLNRLLEGFFGHLTSSKWAKIAKCSPDTALRDIQDLIDRGILSKDLTRGGRSTNYKLRQPDKML